MPRYVPSNRDHLHNFDSGVFGESVTRMLSEPGITDIVFNGAESWVDRGCGLELVPIALEEPVGVYAQRLVAAGGRHLDEVTPIADVRVGRVRVHAVLPPIAKNGPLVSLRVFRDAQFELSDLSTLGTFSKTDAHIVDTALRQRSRILISGATGSGKTTILRALLAELPAAERIIAIEDVAELAVPHPHAVTLEARQANVEGAGAVEMRELVRAALRMRPDWLVIGECRGVELVELLSALHTGHAGASTLHANSLCDVPFRLEAIALQVGMPAPVLARIASSALDLLIHVERDAHGNRQASLARLCCDRGELIAQPIREDHDRGRLV